MKHNWYNQAVSVVCLLAAGIFFAACDNPAGNDDDGGPPVLPVYTMKFVPAGTVNVDVDYNGDTAGNWEGPFSNAAAENVAVSAFYIGETEITWELWKAVYDWAAADERGANKYSFVNSGRQGGDFDTGPVGTNQHPVTEISWRDAVVWCNAYSEAAGKKPVYYLEGTTDFTNGTKVLRESEGSSVANGEGKAEKAVKNGGANGFRLPTSEQWEYAARGGVPGTSGPWTYTYSGSNSVDDVAVYWDDDSVTADSGSTAAVKSKAANTLRLYDMSGNGWEWCEDVFSGLYPVIRGGSWYNNVILGSGWYDNASYCAVAVWYDLYPYDWDYDLGFRVSCP
jgi:formylglycine-generating enzyme required for sulfatase activity